MVFFKDLLGVLNHVVFNTPARDGSNELTVLGDGHLRSGPTRRRTVGLHHSRNRDLLAGVPPALNVWQKLFHMGFSLPLALQRQILSERLQAGEIMRAGEQ